MLRCHWQRAALRLPAISISSAPLRIGLNPLKRTPIWFDDSNAFTTDLVKGKGSYWFPDWTDDNMTITVDFNYGIVTMVKGSTGIESVVAADVEKEYYRLDGTRVMGMPEKGFYIVREGNKVTKMIR